MSELNEKPWWFPQLTDEAWANRIRADYPERAKWSDEQIRDQYAEGCKYADTWDHLGDARGAYETLADAYLALLATRGASAVSLSLNGKQIKDLALFAGFSVNEDDESMLDADYVVCECPPEGVRNDGEPEDPDSVSHYALIAYCEDCPEEGCVGLGPELAERAKDRP